MLMLLSTSTLPGAAVLRSFLLIITLVLADQPSQYLQSSLTSTQQSNPVRPWTHSIDMQLSVTPLAALLLVLPPVDLLAAEMMRGGRVEWVGMLPAGGGDDVWARE
jgi:hypothetical protein